MQSIENTILRKGCQNQRNTKWIRLVLEGFFPSNGQLGGARRGVLTGRPSSVVAAAVRKVTGLRPTPAGRAPGSRRVGGERPQEARHPFRASAVELIRETSGDQRPMPRRSGAECRGLFDPLFHVFRVVGPE